VNRVKKSSFEQSIIWPSVVVGGVVEVVAVDVPVVERVLDLVVDPVEEAVVDWLVVPEEVPLVDPVEVPVLVPVVVGVVKQVVEKSGQQSPSPRHNISQKQEPSTDSSPQRSKHEFVAGALHSGSGPGKTTQNQCNNLQSQHKQGRNSNCCQ